MADSFLSVTRHTDYYIPGADLSFLVGHIQFRVHRYFFERESPMFRTRLATPASPGAQPQGAVDSSAIVLDDVTPEHFATFLWVFYNPRYSLYDESVDSWSVILQLANKWEFPEVKSLAIRELERKDMPDVTRVKLYHDNDVDKNFLIPRYAALCEREDPLTFQEGTHLGIQTAMMIAAGRERVREAQLPNGVRSPLTPTIHGSEIHGVIRKLFDIEAVDTSSSSTNTEVPPKKSGGLEIPPAQQGTNQWKEKQPLTDNKKGKGGKNPPKLTSKSQTTSPETMEGTPPTPLAGVDPINKGAEAEASKKAADAKHDEPPATTGTREGNTVADAEKAAVPPTNENSTKSPLAPLPAVPSPVADKPSTSTSTSYFNPSPLFDAWHTSADSSKPVEDLLG